MIRAGANNVQPANAIATSMIQDGAVTAPKLASTLDLTGKTISNLSTSGLAVTGGAFSLVGATNAVSAAVATVSTNKVAVNIGGTTYYLLATTVP